MLNNKVVNRLDLDAVLGDLELGGRERRKISFVTNTSKKKEIFTNTMKSSIL